MTPSPTETALLPVQSAVARIDRDATPVRSGEEAEGREYEVSPMTPTAPTASAYFRLGGTGEVSL